MHPERLRGVILSAPAIYAMPDPDAVWPMGMKARQRKLTWGTQTSLFQISPDMESWHDAAQVPVAVVIGLHDLAKLSDKPQQGGWTRLDRARHYVNRVQKVADSHGYESRIELFTVPGVGHNSARLTPTAQESLARILQAEL